MNKSFTSLCIIIILLLSIPTYSQARIGYVSDMLILTFRQGPGTSFSVMQTLKSNTPLTILEEDKGYYKVELTSGTIGWVDKQFIVFETPKTQIIEKLNQEKSSLETRIETLANTLDQLKAQLATQEFDQGEKTAALTEDLKEAVDKNITLSTQLKEIQANYSTLKVQSQNVLEVVEKNKVIEEKNILLANSLAQLEKETSHLFKTGM
ncbi:MAG: TIGR04211 family SH3 domain-containing protein, partial [Desulfobacteraceae bacterium]|nr:TIGR04211 family SH3 domain-containing protein [Desulfobacteraceae bacterium]